MPTQHLFNSLPSLIKLELHICCGRRQNQNQNQNHVDRTAVNAEGTKGGVAPEGSIHQGESEGGEGGRSFRSYLSELLFKTYSF